MAQHILTGLDHEPSKCADPRPSLLSASDQHYQTCVKLPETSTAGGSMCIVAQCPTCQSNPAQHTQPCICMRHLHPICQPPTQRALIARQWPGQQLSPMHTGICCPAHECHNKQPSAYMSGLLSMMNNSNCTVKRRATAACAQHAPAHSHALWDTSSASNLLDQASG